MDWCDGGPVGPLARLSYSMHKSLASELGRDTGYREVRTFSVAASAKPGDFRTSAPGFALCSLGCIVGSPHDAETSAASFQRGSFCAQKSAT